jgi:hypothetical protein
MKQCGPFVAILLLFSCGCAVTGGPPATTAPVVRPVPAGAGGTLVLARTSVIEPAAYLTGLGDRAAPFMPYEVSSVTVHEYRDKASGAASARVFVISLATPLDAWGLSRAVRRAWQLDRPSRGKTAVPVTDCFSRDRAVVIVTPVQDSGVVAAEIVALSAAVARLLPSRDALPPEVTALTGFLRGDSAIVHEPQVCLGSPLLAPALMAVIDLPDGGRATVFVGLKGSPAEAGRAFDTYLLDHSAGRRGVSFTPGVGELAATLWDDHRGWINLAREGSHLVGVAGLEDPDAGWGVLTSLLNTLTLSTPRQPGGKGQP